MAYRFVSDTDLAAFDAFVLQHPLGTMLQKSRWAQIKENWGHKYVSVMRDDVIVLTALVLIKPLPLGFCLYYLPRGPICDYEDEGLLAFFFDAMKRMGKKEHAICMKFDPLVIYDRFRLKDHVAKSGEDAVTARLKRLGAKHFGYNLNMYEATQPRTQAVFYYHDGWKDQPSANLKKYIQRANNKGVQLMRGGVEQLDIFADLLKKTGERKHVALRSKEYFARMLDAYGDDCAIFLTYLNQKEQLAKAEAELERIQRDLQEHPRSEKKMGPIRQSILGLENEIKRLQQNIAADGETAWISASLVCKDERRSELFYAGMDGKYSKYYGSYLSYQAAIAWAGDAGCELCNFGGVQGTLDDGLTPFKDVFQPMFEEYIGEFDYPILTWLYPLFTKALPLAKRVVKSLARNK